MECNFSTEFVLIAGWQCTECYPLEEMFFFFFLTFSFVFPHRVCVYICTFHMRLITTQSINCSQLFWICTYSCVRLDFASVVRFKVLYTIQLVSRSLHKEKKKKKREKIALKYKYTYERTKKKNWQKPLFVCCYICWNKCTLAFWNFEQANDYKVLPHEKRI